MTYELSLVELAAESAVELPARPLMSLHDKLTSFKSHLPTNASQMNGFVSGIMSKLPNHQSLPTIPNIG